ncbi:hypothetical protein [Kaistia terrae]|uniref:Acyl-CoA dehydrogenase n=1 Tax=Kaistia terrae TaxID=537017 RepID=A0ABW0PWK5_9HYPH|nr:hypothetical protein [Kaistia terrae]MCX5580636.1 hypothetical protein [Kaistia terrae]
MSNRFESEAFRCEEPGGLDDATRTYVEAAGPCFEDLRAVTAQLGGLLLLAASGARSAGPHHPMLAVAADLLESARDATLRLTPRSAKTRHHHDHLVATATRLTETLALISAAPLSREGVTEPKRLLDAAWAELGAASRALPGFDLIDLTGACCAMHAPGLVTA